MKNNAKRFDFTRRDKRGSVEKCGYLDLTQTESGAAELYFYGDIVSAQWLSEWYAEDKCPQDIADFLNQIDNKSDLTIYFNSGGGDVFAGVAICNILRRHEGHKRGIVDGLAASIASVILMACDEITIKTGAQVMIHKPWCYTAGNADDLRQTITELDKCEESILDIYATKTVEGVTREAIAEKMAAETWLSAAEFGELFVSSVEAQAAIAACKDSAFFSKYNNLPENLKTQTEKDNDQDNAAALLWDLDLYGI